MAAWSPTSRRLHDVVYRFSTARKAVRVNGWTTKVAHHDQREQCFGEQGVRATFRWEVGRVGGASQFGPTVMAPTKAVGGVDIASPWPSKITVVVIAACKDPPDFGSASRAAAKSRDTFSRDPQPDMSAPMKAASANRRARSTAWGLSSAVRVSAATAPTTSPRPASLGQPLKLLGCPFVSAYGGFCQVPGSQLRPVSPPFDQLLVRPPPLICGGELDDH